MSVLEVLVGAKALLEKRGWCQGMPGLSSKVCSSMAIAQTHALESLQLEAYHRLLDEIRATGWSHTTSVVTWNDEYERTKEQVLAAYDGAIARERARAQP